MKKRGVIIGIIVAIALLLTYFVGTGFMKQTVILTDYAVYENEITLYIGVTSSMGYVRGYKDSGGGEKPHYLTFYSTFGGLNSSFGAMDTFVLQVPEDSSEIYFYAGDGGYELVLQRNAETGTWEMP